MIKYLARGIHILIGLVLVTLVCAGIGMGGGPKVGFAIFLFFVGTVLIAALLAWSHKHAKWGE